MVALGSAAFLLYALTLAPGVSAGLPTTEACRALGLLPGHLALSPLWLTLAKGAAHLPLLAPPIWLNLLSAACGTLSVAWLFRLARRLLIELARGIPSFRLIPSNTDGSLPDDAAPADWQEEEDADTVSRQQRVASFGAALAALAFACSAPAWIASTTLRPQAFQILILLATGDLLASYFFTGQIRAGVAAAFLLGVGTVETELFLPVLPLAAFVLLAGSIRFGQISESFFLTALIAGLAGALANALLFLLHTRWADGVSLSLALSNLANLARHHPQALIHAWPRAVWPFVAAQTLLPLAFATVSLRCCTTLTDEVTRWKWNVANLLVTLYAVACLMNAPRTAWSLARAGSHLPLFSFLCLAFAVGALAAFWLHHAYALFPRHTADEDGEEGSAHRLLRPLGFALCGLLGLVSLRTLHTNFDDADNRRSDQLGELCSLLLEQAGDVGCILSDGTLDLSLLAHVGLSGRQVALLPDAPPNEPSQRGPRLRLIQTSQAPHDAPAPNAPAFVAAWLRANPDRLREVVAVGNPRFWQRSGYRVFPNGLVYTGLPSDAPAPDPAVLLEANAHTWSRLHPLVADIPTLRPERRNARTRVREAASRSANELGLLLESLGAPDQAAAAYAEALLFDGSNLPADLNRLVLELRRAPPVSRPPLVRQLETLATRPAFAETFAAQLVRYGGLAPQKPDTFLPALLQACSAPGDAPPAWALLLANRWLRPAEQPPALPALIAQTAPAALTPGSAEPADPKLAQALQEILQGNDQQAEKFLRLLVMRKPEHLSAWALLAELLTRKSQFREVGERVIPAMQAAANGTNSVLLELVRGNYLARPGSPDRVEARDCFTRAIDLQPALSQAHDALLNIDLQLGDAPALERHALAALASLPDHAKANALLGGLRLAQKRLDEAESLLRRSLKTQHSPGALNDLAELLRQRNDLAAAERFARQAVNRAPDFPQAWSTLGEILHQKGETPAAISALFCAVSLQAPTPRAGLLLARLYQETGDARACDTLLKRLPCLTSEQAPAARSRPNDR